MIGSCLGTIGGLHEQLPELLWAVWGPPLGQSLQAGCSAEAEVALELVCVLLQLEGVDYSVPTIKPVVLGLVEGLLALVEHSLDQAVLQTGAEAMRLMLQQWPGERQLMERIGLATAKLLSNERGVVDPVSAVLAEWWTQ